MNVQGAVALITGAAKRVGRAIALELAEAGADIAIHYHLSESEALETASAIEAMGRKAICIAGDLNDPQIWPRLIAAVVRDFGKLNILVNNASMFHTDAADTFENFDADLWEQMLRVNLTAPAALSYFAAPHLCKNPPGKIINLGDAATGHPSPRNLSYSASKGGIEVLTKALARELAPEIQVNAIGPGIAVFPDDYSPQLREKLTAKVPLRRSGTPQDIARLVRFLVEDGDYFTGAIIPVDGGRSIA